MIELSADGDQIDIERQDFDLLSWAYPRAIGAVVGLAVGDALGTTLEFSRRDSRPLHREMTGGGPFDLAPGVWTDDTAMALALAHSILHCRGLDPTDLMQRFQAWWRKGEYSPTGTCFDIGVTTREALARFKRTGDPFAGSTDPRTAGNGGIMRLAPAVVCRLRDPEPFAIIQSRTTHAAPEALDAARLMALILGKLVCLERSATVNDLLVSDFSGSPAIEAIARGEWRTKSRDAIRSSGYVVHTLEAALWSVGNTQSFEEALVLAVNLADDADTVGAVTGQIAGAMYGEDLIPNRWLEKIARLEELRSVTRRLMDLNFVAIEDENWEPKDSPDYGPAELRGIAAHL